MTHIPSEKCNHNLGVAPQQAAVFMGVATVLAFEKRMSTEKK
jgi:hypothetical protein